MKESRRGGSIKRSKVAQKTQSPKSKSACKLKISQYNRWQKLKFEIFLRSQKTPKNNTN